jgi:hypothetical protein
MQTISWHCTLNAIFLTYLPTQRRKNFPIIHSWKQSAEAEFLDVIETKVQTISWHCPFNAIFLSCLPTQGRISFPIIQNWKQSEYSWT